ncbi:MAG TPA: methyltransferase domain-containing protein [Thermoanaerobaculia bacterium]|nr:methyltransferase domain-containing protein [Thermoanaerobaculia bacterium]
MLKHALLATSRRLRLGAIERYWSAAFAAGGVGTWLREPVVRRYVNEAVTGSSECWPMEWLRDLMPATLERVVSLGCGDGALERDIRRKAISRFVLGIDLSAEALVLARDNARAEGLDGIEYERQDLNDLVLAAGAFDAAFFHQALHHVENLAGCLAMVAASLKPQGILYLDEYIGPSRSEWRRRLIAEADAIYQGLPSCVRRRRRLAMPVDWRDPSEATRSSHILTALEARFSIAMRRDYGGTFLSVTYPHLDFSRVSPTERDELLAKIIDAERAHLEAGGQSYYAVLVARPKDC